MLNAIYRIFFMQINVFRLTVGMKVSGYICINKILLHFDISILIRNTGCHVLLYKQNKRDWIILHLFAISSKEICLRNLYLNPTISHLSKRVYFVYNWFWCSINDIILSSSDFINVFTILTLTWLDISKL